MVAVACHGSKVPASAPPRNRHIRGGLFCSEAWISFLLELRALLICVLNLSSLCEVRVVVMLVVRKGYLSHIALECNQEQLELTLFPH